MTSAVEILSEQILSDDGFTLKKITFQILGPRGQWVRQAREAYESGSNRDSGREMIRF